MNEQSRKEAAKRQQESANVYDYNVEKAYESLFKEPQEAVEAEAKPVAEEKRPTISIVIPHYSESEEMLSALYTSITMQMGVTPENTEIIFVYDGDFKEGRKQFGSFPCRHMCTEVNSGSGVARQVGLDIADGEYVLFIDADDCLHNVGVIEAFFNVINEHPEANIITSDWIEELLVDGRKIYVPHSIDNTWMHGKAFKRSFIKECNVSFHPHLRIHEDSYFLTLLFSYAEPDTVFHIPHPTYMWRYNENSITRKNDAEYTYKGFPKFIDAIVLTFGQLEKRGFAKEIIQQRILQLTLYTYFTVFSSNWTPAKRFDIEKHLIRRIPYWFNQYDVYGYINEKPASFQLTYNTEREKCWKNNEFETKPIFNWLESLQLI